uniref:Transmembrane protein n=1 Tax=Hordeum vulgare subsp. vulgare TaxID=112509 RepID=A0A8I6Y5X0_HORVV
MSWSSGHSAVAAPGFRRATRRREEESRSPVPYRESPMAYEPAKFCWCNPRRKAPRWISWSIPNPGRRYYACVDAMVSFILMVFLLFFPQFEDATPIVAVPEAQIDREVLAMSLQDQLKEKNAEIATLKRKYHNVVFVFAVFVLGLVAGKILLQ